MKKRFSADTVGSVQPITYQWSLFNATGISFSSPTNERYVEIDYATALSGELRCLVTDATGCQRQVAVTLGTLPTPQPLVFNISCETLTIDDFVGGPDVAILLATTTGVLTVNQDNSLTYTKINNTYTDVFQYRFVDGNGNMSAISTITINVVQCLAPCNNTILIDKLSYDELSSLITFSIVVTGLYDPEDLVLTSNLGEITDLGQGNYSIEVDQSATYIITAQLENNACDVTDIATIATNFSEPPVLSEDTYYSNINSPITLYPLQNDSDPEGGSLSIVSVTNQSVVVGTQIQLTEGVLLIGNGSILFTPASNWSGTISVPYIAKSSVSQKESPSVIHVTVQCFAPSISLIQFDSPNANNQYKAIYDFEFLNASGATVVCEINGTPISLSSHIEIDSGLLVIGENELIITLTTCDSTTFTHTFNVTELP